MNSKEFQAVLDRVTNKKNKLVDVEKVKALRPEEKKDVVYILGSRRVPILTAFVTDEVESWLASMGYNYWVTDPRTKFRFVCTAESKIKFDTDGRF